MTEKDLTTGLPVVPEGYFWRVKVYYEDQNFPYGWTLKLQLREARKRFGSRRIDYSYTVLKTYDPRDVESDHDTRNQHQFKMIDVLPEEWPGYIYDAAVALLKEHEETMLKDAAFDLAAREAVAYKGDYPPKKLGD